jgi:hypothetical protein
LEQWESLSLFTQQQLTSILSSLPDPAFILTRSGRYAAILGGKDLRHYHDGSALVGRSMFEVLKEEKARWPRLKRRWKAVCSISSNTNSVAVT